MSPLESWISAAWERRRAGAIAETRREWLALCRECGLRPEASLAEELAEVRRLTGNAAVAIDFVLFRISFLEPLPARQRFAELEEIVTRRGLPRTHQFYFTRGLHAFYLADYSRALAAFSGAIDEASTPQQRIYASLNEVLCFENLGYDYRPRLAKLGEELPSLSGEWRKPVLAQAADLRFRNALRALDETKLRELAPGAADADQLNYHCAWLAGLPIFSLELDAEARERLSRRVGNYQVAYLLRTLDGMLDEDDLAEAIPMPDQIERLYLWTWQWLHEPKPERAHRLVRLTRHLLACSRGGLVAEDLAMIENALRWLALFLGWDENVVRARLRGEQAAASHRALWLDYERAFLDACFARRDRDSAREQAAEARLAVHPALNTKWFRLPHLRTDAPLRELAVSLSTLVPSEELTEGFVVDLATGHIERYRDGRIQSRTDSPGLAAFLYALTQRPEWHVLEVMTDCFGIPAYDSAIHDGKIAKLSARAKKFCLPHLSVTRRGDHLRGELVGTVWRFRSNSAHTASLRQARALDAFSLAAETETALRPVRRARLRAADWLTRQQLQEFSGVSRATLNRRLSAWSLAGRVQVQGRGKASRYHFVDGLPSRREFSVQRSKV